MDYRLVARIRQDGNYEAFKKRCEELILDTLGKTALAMLRTHIDGKFSSTPLTIERDVKSYQGAITGWAFTNDPGSGRTPASPRSRRPSTRRSRTSGKRGSGPSRRPDFRFPS
ncbi:MAG: hypothetical protein M0C28_18335 [Candidatus Moduliflexus flocculans]|nr:hypothetical protein [Candidatus Moduliflexus flocculans]